MSDLYMVTVEHISDGMFDVDPREFNTEREAIDYAAVQTVPDRHVVIVYRCETVRVFDQLTG